MKKRNKWKSAICLTGASSSLGSTPLNSHISCRREARACRETLKCVMCLIWKACETFFHFLGGINIIELSSFISQIWWQLSSEMVAERRACERCGESWNLHHGEERIFLCILRRSEGLFFGLFFWKRPWQILGWAEPAGVGTESIWVWSRSCCQRKPNPFFGETVRVI